MTKRSINNDNDDDNNNNEDGNISELDILHSCRREEGSITSFVTNRRKRRILKIIIMTMII